MRRDFLTSSDAWTQLACWIENLIFFDCLVQMKKKVEKSWIEKRFFNCIRKPILSPIGHRLLKPMFPTAEELALLQIGKLSQFQIVKKVIAVALQMFDEVYIPGI